MGGFIGVVSLFRGGVLNDCFFGFVSGLGGEFFLGGLIS